MRTIESWNGERKRDIFHLDIKESIDSLFLIDGTKYFDPFPPTGISVSDFEFINDSLTNFYQVGDWRGSFEPSPGVTFNRDYNNSIGVNSFHGITYNLEIICFDSSYNVYVYADNTPAGIFTQSENGYYELIQSTENYKLVTTDKYHPNILFVEDDYDFLYKSIDTGKTFYIVDSNVVGNNYFYSSWDYLNRFFLFDSDSVHIYRVNKSNYKYQLTVSNNSGELNSWDKAFESEEEIFISLDNSQSGSVFFTSGNMIYHSSDFGQSFSTYKQLKNPIAGIYKKPNSDLLFVSTPHQIMEINSDSIRILKQFYDYESLSFYPLHIGDKWNYRIVFMPSWVIGSHQYNLTKRVIGDSLFQSGNKYFVIEETRDDTNLVKTYFERIDSLNAKVYRLDSEINNNEEYLYLDLQTTLSDSFQTFIDIFNDDQNKTLIFREEKIEKLFETNYEENMIRKYSLPYDNPYEIYKLDISQNFGKSYQAKGYLDAYDEYQTLVAAYINGVKYGDTTLVSFKDDKISTSNSFSLSQNYPNPFNPTTTIKYTLPYVETNGYASLQLVVYDILGREVKTLVDEKQKAGNYSVQFDGSHLSSGIYFYKLSYGEFVETKKMLLLK